MVRDARVRRLRDGADDLPRRQGARRGVHRRPGVPGPRLPPRRDHRRHPARHRQPEGPRGQARSGSTAATRSPPACGRASILADGVRRRPRLDHLGALRRRARRQLPAAGQRRADRRPGATLDEMLAERRARRRRRRRDRLPRRRAADPRPGRGRRSRRCSSAASTRSTTWSWSATTCSRSDPELGAQVFDAFARVQAALRRAAARRRDRVPTTTDRMYARVMELTGADPLPYGIEPNRAVLEELLRHAVDQKILDRAPRLEDVFAAGHPRPRRLRPDAHRHRRRPQRRRAQGAAGRGAACPGARGRRPRRRRRRGRRRLPAAVRGRLPPGRRRPRRPRRSSSAAAAWARSSPATRSAASAPACAPTSGTREISRGNNDANVLVLGAKVDRPGPAPSRWWTPG